MPIYEYKCPKCGEFEVTQRITENALKKCPTCKSKVERMLSRTSFILKGTGWYATDYAKSNGDASKVDSAKPDLSKSDSPKSDTPKADTASKPESVASSSDTDGKSVAASSTTLASSGKSNAEKSIPSKSAD